MLQVQEFSESERDERSCTETRNCSQKERQFKMFPSNVGKSNFGNFTPLWSGAEGEDPAEGELESESLLLTSTKESNTCFSRAAS